MLLHSLHVQNIRSYGEQFIPFPQGMTLLSGDIGSGKSTLLQAIEFALFGVSRPDLPAEALLKKGATHASVKLEFSLAGKKVTVERKLKREKEGIKQLPGSLTLDQSKRELMPVELKAEIISLLGYPEEFLSKNKNYLFRYTVYCPQEEMKRILQEDAEIRVDMLRKIFNLDKYKIIRENMQMYLKELRTRKVVLEEKIVPLQEKEKHLLLLKEEISDYLQHLQQLSFSQENLQRDLQQSQQQLSELEKQQQQRRETLQQLQTSQSVIQEKNIFLQQAKEKMQALHQEVQELGASLKTNLFCKEGEILSLQEISALIFQEEQERKKNLTARAAIQGQFHSLERRKAELQTEGGKLEQQLAMLPEKINILELLRKELLQKDSMEAKRKQLEDLFLQVSTLRSRNETLLQQSLHLQQRMLALGECPTCLQEVTEEHRQHILSQEEQKIAQAQRLLQESQQKRQEILQQKTELQQTLQELQQKEYLFNKISIERAQLQEKQKRSQLVEEEIALVQEEIKKTVQESERWKEEVLLEKERNLDELQKQRQSLLWKEHKEKQRVGLQEEIYLQERSLYQLQEQVMFLQKKAEQFPEVQEAIAQTQRQVQQMLYQEKELLLRERELCVHLQEREKRFQDLQKEILQMQQERELLLQVQKISHWLEQFFLPLTGTLEKHILLSIQRHFNSLFQEWFALLMESEHLTARIDDAFTPVIEQDGYEIFFEHLSGGERTSAALAYRLALNRAINDVIHNIKTKELFILDEPTDGFSSEQLDRVREVLQRLQLQQMIIVSHESKMESFVQQVIRVQKEGGESRVVNG